MDGKQKIKRRKNLCTLSISLDSLQKEIEYAVRQIKLEDPELNLSNVRVFSDSDDNFERLVLEYSSLETDAEYRKRRTEEAIIKQFEKAKEEHLPGFLIDCFGNPEKLSTAAAVITQLHYSDNDCIVSGKPIFADEREEHQTGIEVSIRYFGEDN
jgi:hypothetical protein